MARGATNHGAQGDDGVIFAAFGHTLRCQRNLESARNPCQCDVLIGNAMAHERILCAGNELRDDEFVETGGDDADFGVFRYDFSFIKFHDAVPFFAVACLRILR